MEEEHAGILVPLRAVDADAYGHVHHATFLSLIEHARILWLLRVLDAPGPIWDHTTVHLAIDYRAELLVEHREVLCSFRVHGVGKSSIELIESMESPDGITVADLRTVIVAWNPPDHSSRQLTDAEREVLRGLRDRYTS